MRDIYELLNDVDIEESVMEYMEVTDLEKERVKKKLKMSIKKNRFWNKKAAAAAVLALMLVGGTSIIGIVNPTYAANVPIVGDIFRFFDNGRTGVYEKYKENANEINVTKESNGVSITIKDAIFDGRTISYTYEIKSNKDLGEHPFMGMGGGDIKIEGFYGGLAGSSGVKKVSENTYVGVDTYTMNEERKQIHFRLDFKDIEDMSNEKAKPIKGNWNFKISLTAMKSMKQSVNKGTEKDGIKVNIDSISKTPATFSIDYSQTITEEIKKKWLDVHADLEVKDDLGNIYKGEDNGASGVDEYTLNCRKTFGRLNEKAHQIMITPKIHMSNTGGGVSMDKDGKEVPIKPTIDKNHPEKGESVLELIVVNLEK